MEKLKAAEFAKILREGAVVNLGTVIGDDAAEAFESRIANYDFNPAWAAKCRKAGSLTTCKVRQGEVVFENESAVRTTGCRLLAERRGPVTILAIHEQRKGEAASAYAHHTYIVATPEPPAEEAPKKKGRKRKDTDEAEADAPNEEATEGDQPTPEGEAGKAQPA